MNSYVLFFFVCVTLSVAIATEFEPELPCTEVGGICADKSTCPNSRFSDGLCPKQQINGAECCDSPEEAECRSIGGECISDCPGPLTFRNKKCPDNRLCCVWLQ